VSPEDAEELEAFLTGEEVKDVGEVGGVCAPDDLLELCHASSVDELLDGRDEQFVGFTLHAFHPRSKTKKGAPMRYAFWNPIKWA
jgi:hypothetical protein